MGVSKGTASVDGTALGVETEADEACREVCMPSFGIRRDSCPQFRWESSRVRFAPYVFKHGFPQVTTQDQVSKQEQSSCETGCYDGAKTSEVPCRAQTTIYWNILSSNPSGRPLERATGGVT